MLVAGKRTHTAKCVSPGAAFAFSRRICMEAVFPLKAKARARRSARSNRSSSVSRQCLKAARAAPYPAQNSVLMGTGRCLCLLDDSLHVSWVDFCGNVKLFANGITGGAIRQSCAGRQRRSARNQAHAWRGWQSTVGRPRAPAKPRPSNKSCSPIPSSGFCTMIAHTTARMGTEGVLLL